MHRKGNLLDIRTNVFFLLWAERREVKRHEAPYRPSFQQRWCLFDYQKRKGIDGLSRTTVFARNSEKLMGYESPVTGPRPTAGRCIKE